MVKIPRFASKWVNIASLVVVAVAVIVASFYFLQYQKSQKLLQNPEAKAQADTQKLLDEVGKVFALPGGTPTIATVSDRSKLSEQQFFAAAQNGDKVLIYTDAKKAILYRPSTKQVIEVGPITIQDNQATGSAGVAGASEQKITVAVFNGTTRTGLTKGAGDKIAGISGFDVTERVNAAQSDYENTIVVDVSGKNKTAAEALAARIGAEVATLPSDEDAPETDLLVILGADYQE